MIMLKLITIIILIMGATAEAQNPKPSVAQQVKAPAGPFPTPNAAQPKGSPSSAENLQAPAPFSLAQIPHQANEIRRDPFRLPEYLINKFKFVPAMGATRIDDSVDPVRRWPLNTYGLIGIIWDVKTPKALIMDQQRKVHMVRVRDKIGNAGGIITSIQEGSMVVIQDKIPEVMRLKK